MYSNAETLKYNSHHLSLLKCWLIIILIIACCLQTASKVGGGKKEKA